MPRNFTALICRGICRMRKKGSQLKNNLRISDVADGTLTVEGTVQTPGESGPVEGAVVSDGYNLARTDHAGRYRLSLAEKARWIMVVNPSGYKPDSRLYARIPGNRCDLRNLDFCLEPLGHSPRDPFFFVHLSDAHIASPYRGERLKIELAEAINKMPERPLFVLDSGDLSINSEEQLEIASAVIKRIKIPYISAIGNHDEARGEAFERLIQPPYFAFTCGKYLIITLPWNKFALEALAWTRKILQEFGEEFHVMVCTHHLIGLDGLLGEFGELFRKYRVKAIFSGHYHTNQVTDYEGIPVYVVRGAVARNNDYGRPVFNLVKAGAGGKIEVSQRQTGQDKKYFLVMPDRNGAFNRGTRQEILVSALDSSAGIRGVRAVVHDAGVEGRLLAEISLEPLNACLWRGFVFPDETWTDKVYVHIEIEDETGERWPPLHVLRQVAGGRRRPRPGPAAQNSVSLKRPAKKNSEVTLAWVYGVKGSFEFGMPVLCEGVIYAGVQNISGASRLNPVLVAVDAGSGKLIWEHRARGFSVRSAPLMRDGLVVAQADDGQVFAVRREDGGLVWKNRDMVPGVPSTQIFFSSSPVALGEKDVLAGAGFIYSRIRLEDGKARWRTPGCTGTRGVAPASPSVIQDRIVIVQGDSETKAFLNVLDAETGESLWKHQIWGCDSTPAVNNGIIYAVLRIRGNVDSKKSLWSEERWAAWAAAIELDSGKFLWKMPLLHRGENACSPLVMDGAMIAVDYDELAGMDASTGEVLWRVSFAEAISEQEYLMSREMVSAARYDNALHPLMVADPEIKDGCIYLVSRAGTVIAVDLVNRELMWTYPLDTTVLSKPVATGNMVYVAGSNGGLYALAEPK